MLARIISIPDMTPTAPSTIPIVPIAPPRLPNVLDAVLMEPRAPTALPAAISIPPPIRTRIPPINSSTNAAVDFAISTPIILRMLCLKMFVTTARNCTATKLPLVGPRC